jgi:hypothetical protein
MEQRMSLKIVIAPPPDHIYEACDAKFKIRGRRGVIFTVGGQLFNPDNIYIDPPLLAHEQVHSTRQLATGDVPTWWDQYQVNKEFRFAEELVAHQEEWRVIRGTMSSRQQRRQALGYITSRLSGSLYGNLVTKTEAKRLITRGAE